jgi:hypothetical protein
MRVCMYLCTKIAGMKFDNQCTLAAVQASAVSASVFPSSSNMHRHHQLHTIALIGSEEYHQCELV